MRDDARPGPPRPFVGLDDRTQRDEVYRKLLDAAPDAVIVVDKTNPAPGKVRLNYLVDSASWRPQYKLRAGQGPNDPIQVEYLAAVVQQTGEDWANVKLVLSTAQPMLNAAPPELRTLTVQVVPRGASLATSIVLLGILATGVGVWAMVRFGLLPIVVGLFTAKTLVATPVTLDANVWYSGVTVFSIALVAGLMVLGFLLFRAAPPVSDSRTSVPVSST